MPSRPDRRGVLGIALGLVGGAALAACTGGEGVEPTTAPTGEPSSPEVQPAPEDLQEVTALLTARAGALVAGDDGAFAATVSRGDAAAQDRQLTTFRAARDLRVSRLAVEDVQLDRDPTALPGEPASLASAVLRYRVDDLDRGDRTAAVSVRVVRAEGRWFVASEQPSGPGSTAPWLALPGLQVRRTEHAVVAGTVAVERLAEYARIAGRALPVLRRDWARTPERVLVLAPAISQEADVLLGRDGGASAQVGATTEGPTDGAGRATGDRVVLDPAAFSSLTPAGRDVVLTHELVHVAVRATVPGRTAAWLAEGYADHVGYQRADVPVEQLLAPLLDEVRAGREPTDLPRLDTLQPASGSIEVPYLAGWQAVEVLVARYGESAVRRLVREGSSTGTDADAEAATDRALVSVLGTSRAALVRQWRAHLDDLARR